MRIQLESNWNPNWNSIVIRLEFNWNPIGVQLESNWNSNWILDLSGRGLRPDARRPTMLELSFDTAARVLSERMLQEVRGEGTL